MAGGVVLILAAVSVTALLAFLERLIPMAPDGMLIVLRIGGYLLLAMLVVTAAAVLFRFAPDEPGATWIWLSPGAILATACWLAGTSLFGLYAANFGDYNATYGSLSAVVVLLTWLWLSAYVFLLGAELNAELERQVGELASTPAKREPDRLPQSTDPSRTERSSPPDTVANLAMAAAGIVLLRYRRVAGAALIVWAVAKPMRRHRTGSMTPPGLPARPPPAAS
ncbi:YihY/virulence factor BrkB family protein [Sphingomonas sp. MMS24-JH45]